MSTSARTTGPSLRNRALLAIALTAGFYLLAIGIAAVLIGAPIMFFLSSGHGNIWVAAAMIGAGIAILRAIVPPPDRFEPPGPQLRPAEHPRLHDVLAEVARQSGAQPADDVYLDLEMNASVLEHRKRRVMQLGLPLLATISVDELRAVVAHEYGHYVGGDTRFGGWIWRTRHAVLTTASELATSGSGFRRNFVRWPFEWYAKLFLRITNAISRRQEFAADQLSAKVASAAAAGSALRRLEALGPLFPRYWGGDVVPMLDARRRPPIALGFAAVAANSNVGPALDDIVRSDIESADRDPYASHPTLRERLEALGAPLTPAAPGPAEHPAVELLNHLPTLEQLLLAKWLGDEVGYYAAADWEEDAAAVHAQVIREAATRFRPAFDESLTVGGAGEIAKARTQWRERVRERIENDERATLPDEFVEQVVLNVLTAIAITAALDDGAMLRARPGESFVITRHGHTLAPAELLEAIAVGKASTDEWLNHPALAGL